MTITCTCEATITTPGRFLCGACEKRLNTDLGRVPEILEELEVEVTRQAVKAVSPGAGGAEGVGYDLVASEIRQDLTRTLTGLDRLISGAVRPSAMVRRRVDRIRNRLPTAVENASITGYAYDLTEQLYRAMQKIDRAPRTRHLRHLPLQRDPDRTSRHRVPAMPVLRDRLPSGGTAGGSAGGRSR